MPLYEHVFLARQDLAQAQVDALAETATKIIEDNGGKVAKTETWGLKSLAYKIDRNRKALLGGDDKEAVIMIGVARLVPGVHPDRVQPALLEPIPVRFERLDSLNMAQRFAESELSLPIHPYLSDEQVEQLKTHGKVTRGRIGVGVQEPSASWGNMLSDAQSIGTIGRPITSKGAASTISNSCCTMCAENSTSPSRCTGDSSVGRRQGCGDFRRSGGHGSGAAARPIGDLTDPVALVTVGIERLVTMIREDPDTWRPILQPPDGLPDVVMKRIEADREQIQELVFEEHPALSSPRQITRYLCGLTSPATSRAKLTKQPMFGCFAAVPFRKVLAEVEQAMEG